MTITFEMSTRKNVVRMIVPNRYLGTVWIHQSYGFFTLVLS